MFRKLQLLVLVFLASALVPVLTRATTREIIRAETLLHCTVSEPNFPAKTAQVGEPLLCNLGPLGAFGHSVFPRGARLGGHLDEAKGPGRFFGKGWMQVTFDSMILPGARILPLAAKIIGDPHKKVDAEGRIRDTGRRVRDAVERAIPIFWQIKSTQAMTALRLRNLRREGPRWLLTLQVEWAIPIFWPIKSTPAMAPLRLRNLRPEDPGWLLTLQKDFPPRENASSSLQVAEVHGVPVGVIGLAWNAYASCEISFSVAPEHRGRGIGKAMVQEAVAACEGVRLLAKVKPDNLAAQRILELAGFELNAGNQEWMFFGREPVAGGGDSGLQG